MNTDFERRLSESLNAERARNEARAEADLPRIKGTLMDSIHSRKRFTMVAAVGATALVLAAAGIALPRLLGDNGSGPLPPAGDNEPSPSPTLTGPAEVEETDVTSGDCSELPFVASYLPDGSTSYEIRSGDGGQVGVSLEKQNPRAYGHYAGNDFFISVYAGGSYYTLPSGSEKISIFDQPAGITAARFGAVDDGFALEFRVNGCSYSAIGLGVTEEDMRTFADGLVQTRGNGVDEQGFAIYPDLTPEDAATGCIEGPEWRRDALAVIERFVTDRLGIESFVANEKGSEAGNRFFTVLAGGRDIATITVKDVGYECWSVLSVGPASKASPSVHSFSFHGDSLELGLTGLSPVLADVYTAAYFAGENLVAEIFLSDFKDHEDAYTMDLAKDPNTQGAFLVLFRDEEGAPVGAFGTPLPTFDTAAG